MLQVHISQMLQLLTMIISLKKKTLNYHSKLSRISEGETFGELWTDWGAPNSLVQDCTIKGDDEIFLQRSCVEKTDVSFITTIPCFSVLEPLKYLGYPWLITKRTSCICASTKNSKAITSMRNLNHGQYKIESSIKGITSSEN